ncbi:aminotransferase [Parcubacteria bacterium DG_74_2]|nr:MAG: aminotransferase [Parcubacteria bacterium DG_74_2]
MSFKYKKLFIPGPTEVRKEILLSQTKPLISHRGSEFVDLHRGIVSKLQKILKTKNKIFIAPSSGTGLMEAAVRNFVKKKALHVGGGAFGELWYKWGKVIKPEKIREKLKTKKYDTLFVTHSETSTGVLHPIKEISKIVKKFPNVIYLVDAISSFGGAEIKVEDWGIDVLISASQKCLAIPPGLAIAVLSKKALKRVREVKNRGYYFDFLLMKKYFDEKGETPTTPAVSLFYALDSSLNEILKEGIKNRYKRHQVMAEYVRNWAEKYFSLFSEKGYESPTVTVIKNNKGINVSSLIKKLGKRGFAIANGYRELREKTFRIAHMGDLTLTEIKELIRNINEVLKFQNL